MGFRITTCVVVWLRFDKLCIPSNQSEHRRKASLILAVVQHNTLSYFWQAFADDNGLLYASVYNRAGLLQVATARTVSFALGGTVFVPGV